MKDDIKVLKNWVYRHFKGGYYYVDDVAIDEVTYEKVVIYREFDEKERKPVGNKYIRKASVFNEIIINKYDNDTNITNQVFRFEPVIIPEEWQKKKKKKKNKLKKAKTGIKDSNGINIREGDHVGFRDNISLRFGTVSYNKPYAGFVVECGDGDIVALRDIANDCNLTFLGRDYKKESAAE